MELEGKEYEDLSRWLEEYVIKNNMISEISM
jgi:hypothetical protein